MSESDRRDIDLGTAAEQSSEEDEAQEGNTLEADERSDDNAENNAIHVEDEDSDAENGDLAGLLEALDAATDPEADAVVDDALTVDSIDEADAAVAATDDEEEIEEEEEAAEVPDVTPYDGPELDDNGDPLATEGEDDDAE